MGLKQTIQKIDFINHAYTNLKWRERKASYGNDNKEKQFYVVRRANAKVGLFSLVLTSLGYIKYALDQGYIPIVDMQNYGHLYKGAKEEHLNMWEYFFEQPCGYSLKDISRSKRVILGNGIISDKIPFPSDGIAYDEKEFQYWKRVAEEYLKVDGNILKEVNILQNRMFGEDRVLGVLARGTDYVNMKPLNHPVQPTTEQLMEQVDKIMQEQQCKKIYLATEDKGIFTKFKEKYGEKVVAMDVERHETKGSQNINDVRRENNKDEYMMAKEYLITILLLAKCQCLVAGNTSGTIGALLLNKDYEYKYIFNLGVYGKNGESK